MAGITKIDLPIRRLETGAVQLGNDWPGVFIRGDEALGFADMLLRLRQEVAAPLIVKNSILDELIETLRSCRVRSVA
jgi:hypothetical protein